MKFGSVQSLVPVPTDPASPSDGDIWYNSTSGVFKVREAGATRNVLNPTGAPGNSQFASGSGVALTTTEAQMLSVTITPSNAAAVLLVVARANFTKDGGTTVRQATVRVRRGATNGDTQVGQDSQISSSNSANSPFGSAVICVPDSPGTTSPVTYTLRGLVSAALNAAQYSLEVFELATKGDTGPTGPAPTGSVGSGTVVDCSSIGGKYYGRPTAITGNLTVNNATAVLGGGAVIRHNDSVVPTFPSNFSKRGSVNYATGSNNTIVVVCVYVDDANSANNVYEYSISQ